MCNGVSMEACIHCPQQPRVPPRMPLSMVLERTATPMATQLCATCVVQNMMSPGAWHAPPRQAIRSSSASAGRAAASHGTRPVPAFLVESSSVAERGARRTTDSDRSRGVWTLWCEAVARRTAPSMGSRPLAFYPAAQPRRPAHSCSHPHNWCHRSRRPPCHRRHILPQQQRQQCQWQWCRRRHRQPLLKHPLPPQLLLSLRPRPLLPPCLRLCRPLRLPRPRRRLRLQWL